MQINSRTIVGMIISLVFVLVLFNMLPTILPNVISSVQLLFTNLSGSAALIGTGPAGFAGNVYTYLGWFWVIGPFVLVIGVILALFLSKRR